MNANKLALAIGIGIGSMSAVPGLAAMQQEPSTGASEPLMERVEVTGSRIKRIDLEGVAPVQVISAVDIEASGLTSITDVLQTSTANSGVNFSADGSYVESASSVNLRGMGVNRTLILINGRRQASFPTAYGGSTNFTDVSDIPASAVERIEILTGGASAIYGSDAIGGVVNIILKKGYEGTEFDARYTAPEQGGNKQVELSFTQGFTTEKSNTMVMVEYKQVEELLNRDRDFLYSPRYYNDDDGDLAWGNGPDNLDAPSSTAAYLRDYDEVFHASSRNYASEALCDDILAGGAVYLPDQSYRCYYDSDATEGVLPADERINLVINTEYQLNDLWNLFGSLQSSYKTSDRFKTDKGIGEDIYMDAADGRLAYTTEGMDDYHRFQIRRRFADFPGQRMYESTVQKYAVTAGASGTLFGEYDLDISWSSALNLYDRNKYHMVNGAALLDNITLDPNDTSDKWYPLDKLTDAQAARLMDVSVTDSEATMNQFQAVLSGDLMEGFAGPIAFATSFEWASESYDDSQDEDTRTGGLLGQGGTNGGGDRQRSALSAELLIPLLDTASGQSLELSTAARYDHYNDDSDVGGAFTPQVGLTYHPTEDLLLRGSWGKSFRAPDMHRLYAGETLGFGSTNLTLASGEVIEDDYDSWSAGNMALEEEKGDYWNLGLVWTPTDSIEMTLDVWEIELRGAVRSVSTNEVLEDPNYNLTGQYASCNQFSGLGYINIVDDGVENLLCMRKGPINAAFESTRGVDARFSKEFELGDLGILDFSVETSYIAEKLYQEYAGGDVEDATQLHYTPKLKANSSVSWRRDNYSLNLTYFYTGEAQGEDYFEYPDGSEALASDTLAAYKTLNVNASYEFPWEGKVTLGVNNATDEMPPLFHRYSTLRNDFPYHADWLGYDVIGRTVYLRYKQTL
ncbi:TonB-dependent receptor [Microbulbifer sp. CAU 1566]|uniref:TonB-dependent receptor domain-containing protein n=1 Tax=unclassified Microbulbifer TaxID=2619833 RepID=UPI00135BE1A7|nr:MULTISPECIES: TonB-dependent receptor [unclassified Microbulbifer]MCK7596576.1 TonB-dependent receptor [Microbulbifer sp. CAU 1566]